MENSLGPYVIVRSRSASPFAGHLKSRNGSDTTLTDARRLWYWDGAASLSQLAVDGTSRPQNCKFPVAVPEVTILETNEIISTTAEGEASIKAVPVWKA